MKQKLYTEEEVIAYMNKAADEAVNAYRAGHNKGMIIGYVIGITAIAACVALDKAGELIVDKIKAKKMVKPEKQLDDNT